MEREEDTSKREEKPQVGPEKTTITGQHEQDGKIIITIDDAKLCARADFYPPIGQGKPLTPDYIASMLDTLQISYGVDWDAIQEAALECNLNHRVIKDVLIAKGDNPTAEIPEYYELEETLQSAAKTIDRDAQRIDYRSIASYIVVKKNQQLAHRKERIAGIEGKTIQGVIIPAPIQRHETYTAGTNTIKTEDAILAACDGRLVINDHELIVDEILEVKGSVGYGTGHIIFPGDVILDGNVADGFKVYSGASIVAKQTFDATDVIAKKDLIVAGGIIGRGQNTIKVGGMVKAKFIQNCRLASRGPIQVSSAIVNSTIYTLDILDLGDKGRIIGGEIFTIHGLKAASIGSETGKTTKIHCGVDFTVQQELDKLNEQFRVLSQKREKLQKLLQDASLETGKKQKLEEFKKQIEAQMLLISNKLTELLPKLNADENASVKCLGEIAKGTLIEICHVALFIDKPIRKVQIHLDKAQGKLVWDAIK
jgi:hypothetical protein